MGHKIDPDSLLKPNGNERHGSGKIVPALVGEIAKRASGFRERHGRPFVTLCYAQSLDGCLSSVPGTSLTLSGPETLTMAHRLRAAHDP